MGFIVYSGTWIQSEIIGYSHDIYGTIVSVSMYYQGSLFCSSQGSQLVILMITFLSQQYV